MNCDSDSEKVAKLTSSESPVDRTPGGTVVPAFNSYPDSGISSSPVEPSMDMASSNVDTDQAMVFSLTDIDTTK